MASFYGCERQGDGTNILNPISSARLRTSNSFAFTYGKVEARAKLPRGDWLWPAIWMLPLKQEYGLWPTSGEIDIMESRGNLNLQLNGVNIGSEQVIYYFIRMRNLVKSSCFISGQVALLLIAA